MVMSIASRNVHVRRTSRDMALYTHEAQRQAKRDIPKTELNRGRTVVNTSHRRVQEGSRIAAGVHIAALTLLSSAASLLERDNTTRLLNLLLGVLGLLLACSLLEDLGRRLDQLLGLLEAEAGDTAHHLQHRNLLVRRE